MGKASKKMAKNRVKQRQEDNAKKQNSLMVTLQKQIQSESYSEALDTVAHLVQAGRHDADVMYQAAYCYFMTGDYERCASWVNNTLSTDGNHCLARILLARLCILEDRIEDALAIIDFVIEHYSAQLQSKETAEIDEILDYYGHRDEKKVCVDYPHIAAYLHLNTDVDTVEVVPVETVKSETVEMRGTEPVAAKMIQQIMGQEISLAEKIRFLNSFAGGEFMAEHYDTARQLLTEALKLDAMHSETLRNMTVILHYQGEQDKALAMAAKLPVTDFVLLNILKGTFD